MVSRLGESRSQYSTKPGSPYLAMVHIKKAWPGVDVRGSIMMIWPRHLGSVRSSRVLGASLGSMRSLSYTRVMYPWSKGTTWPVSSKISSPGTFARLGISAGSYGSKSPRASALGTCVSRSEEHTSELQSRENLV